MLKLLKASLATLLVFNTLCSQLVLAGNLTIQGADDKISSISGDANVGRLGDLRISSGTVALKQNRIDILFDTVDLTQKTDTTQKRKNLTGTCFGLTKITGGGRSIAKGFVLIDGGSGLSEFDQPGLSDTVTLTDGTTCSGHIETVDTNQITVVSNGESRNIAVDAIKRIASPRVLAMTLPFAQDGQTYDAKFTATCDQKVTVKASSNTNTRTQLATQSHPSRKKKIIVTIVVACLIATAIAVPIAVACGGHHHHHGNNDLANQIAFRNLFVRDSAVAPAPAP